MKWLFSYHVLLLTEPSNSTDITLHKKYCFSVELPSIHTTAKHVSYWPKRIHFNEMHISYLALTSV